MPLAMKDPIQPRGPGRWWFRVDLPKSADGKRQRRTITFHGSKRQAQDERARILHEIATGRYVDPARITVAEWLERWLEHKAARVGAGELGAKTLDRYRQIVVHDLTPALGDLPLSRLTATHIRAMEDRALSAGRKRRSRGQGGGTPGLSPRTVLHQHRVLHGALELAVAEGLLAANPADRVQAPRPPDVEMRALDFRGTARLLDLLRGEPLWVPVVLAAGTGMRRGEVMALAWSEVEIRWSGGACGGEARDGRPVGGLVRVRKATEVVGGQVSEKPPKTRRGRRDIPLPAWVAEALVRHKARQAEARLMLGPAYHDSDLVVTWEDGRRMHPDYVTQRFRKAQLAAGLAPIRFHDLRHSHISQAIRQGIEPVVVSERAGHARTSITMDLYAHVLPGRHEAAAEALDSAMRRWLGHLGDGGAEAAP
jgi:integrase